MLITFDWLKEFIVLNESPANIAELLTNIGLEVESYGKFGPELGNGIVTAKIESIYAHPNASRLVICEVFDGAKLFRIVCGAKNMSEGDFVALARPGALLPKTKKFPDGITIKETKLRGELSQGMLCAENELDIGNESDGIMILNKYKPELGQTISSLLGLDDTVFELGITPNRPDCLSVLGIAKELSAVLNRKLIIKNEYFDTTENMDSALYAEVLDPVKCPRYACRYFDDIKIGDSPDFIRHRLEACGVRSINNVVDITNYVMLEYGHPLHAFDSRFVKDSKIVVRAARDGEIIKTLDGAECMLSSEDLLICDSSKPIAIAGVMGGENSQVIDDTKSLILECAYFDPLTVRKTSKKLKLSTESSYRFERGLDPNAVDKVIERASFLLHRFAGARVDKRKVDVHPQVIEQVQVSLDLRKMNSVLGTGIRKNKVEKILGSLGLTKIAEKNKVQTYEIPTFRVDLNREIDLVEEIARIYGYNSISDKLPLINIKSAGNLGSKFHKINDLKKFISSIGFSEAINYSFTDPGILIIIDAEKTTKLLNPISSDQSVMRTSLLPDLIQNLKRNINYQQDNLKLFEIGKIYNLEDGKKNAEFNKLSIASSVERVNNLWDKRTYDYFDMKGEIIKILNYLLIRDNIEFDPVSNNSLLHPGNSSSVLINGINVGMFGELHPEMKSEFDVSRDIYVAELSLDTILEIADKVRLSFTQFSRNPLLRRDLSIVIDNNITAGEILSTIYQMKNENIRNVEITDVYTDKSLVDSGKKSLTVSITLMSDEKTLTDEEANFVQSKTLDRIKMIYSAQLRS